MSAATDKNAAAADRKAKVLQRIRDSLLLFALLLLDGGCTASTASTTTFTITMIHAGCSRAQQVLP